MAIKLASICFGLQLLSILVIHAIFPQVYPGDSFIIIWFYIINFFIGIVLFPLCTMLFKTVPVNGGIKHMLASLLFVLIIFNVVPLLLHHVVYSVKVMKAMLSPASMRVAAAIEFFNPIVCFFLAYALLGYLSRKKQEQEIEVPE